MTYLEISNLRNLNSVKLYPAADLNLIIGDNAAGKTSILESIYFLSVARSFRSLYIKNVIQEGYDCLRVIAKQKIHHRHSENIIGVEKGHKYSKFRINGETINQLSKLASYLPVQLIHPEGHNLLEQGPKQRRKFIDWGVFHVEPEFLNLWQQFTRILKQRNAALRSKQSGNSIKLWDGGFVKYGNKITELRKQYLKELTPYINKYCHLIFNRTVILKYRQGWSQDCTLIDTLQNQLEVDINQGFTHSGPQRAELEIYSENRLVQNYFSRGQQKLLVSALRLAQMDHLKSRSDKFSVLLVDDLAAELDLTHRNNLIAAALASKAQIFVTLTEPGLLSLPDNIDKKVFHVKHGNVFEVV
ncbi:MAG: DNA replication/repair protein RecF [Gammaproteobacteria bacterium]|nr:DNA replication/repair protein RecF [Gammaproteobacteria bacterium]